MTGYFLYTPHIVYKGSTLYVQSTFSNNWGDFGIQPQQKAEYQQLGNIPTTGSSCVDSLLDMTLKLTQYFSL